MEIEQYLQKEKWVALHAEGYHGDFNGMVERVNRDTEKTSFLIPHWCGLFGVSVPVDGKSVFEIGHGGGWYLVQASKLGASMVGGIEICDKINKDADKLLTAFGSNNHKLYEATTEGLSVVKEKYDIVYSITVFQHIDYEITEQYFMDMKNIMTPGGIGLFHFVTSEVRKWRNPRDWQGSCIYCNDEVVDLIKRGGLELVAAKAWAPLSKIGDSQTVYMVKYNV